MTIREIKVEEPELEKRLDAYLADVLNADTSRSQIKKWIEQGGVKVNGREVAAHYKVKLGDVIAVEIVEVKKDGTRAENIPLQVFYEDEHLLLVYKPSGMVVHPAHGNPHHTLVNALLFHTQNLSAVGGQTRPGIVHRLDKDTSGIMIVAKNDKTHAFLAKQFKNQTMERIYRVVVKGVVQHDEGTIDEPVGRAFLNRKKVVVKPSGGKEAMTYFRVMRRFKNATLLELHLHTGRTHQIRVHMRHFGHPVVGDPMYGVASQWIGRQCVHAFSLGFIHPVTKKKMVFECPMPEDMGKLLKHLEEEK